jgi:hypothetical protein
MTNRAPLAYPVIQSPGVASERDETIEVVDRKRQIGNEGCRFTECSCSTPAPLRRCAVTPRELNYTRITIMLFLGAAVLVALGATAP